MVWLRNLFLIGALALLALAVQAVADRGNLGWWVFCVGLLLLLAIHLRNLERTLRWTQNLNDAPPLAAGSWGEVLVRLHRQLRRRDRELAESRDTLQSWSAASQALPDGVVVLDDQLHIEWSNREASRLLGLRFPADRGHNLLNLVRSPAFVQYAQQGDWPDSRVVPAPGDLEMSLRVQFIRYSGSRRLLVVRDVTQPERVEAMRRDFVANVSHELRTPLTVLTGFLETLHEAPPGALTPEQHQQYLSLMREQASRMQSIVADLLTLSSLESTRVPEHPGFARVPTLIAGAREQAQALSGGQHRFEWQVDPQLDVEGVSAELSSAISNLLTNAVRYTPPGGQIRLTWQPTPEGGAELQVRDDGPGIAAQHLPRLTERFYRVDRGRSRAVGGTGLGLAITKQVATRHDAELRIRSEVGHGSTFSLVFPAERRASLLDSPAEGRSPQPG